MHLERIGNYFILYETGKFQTPIKLLLPLELLSLRDDINKAFEQSKESLYSKNVEKK